MMLHTGIITPKLLESKSFYTTYFGFKVKFENEWFILLETNQEPSQELAFLLPDQSFQHPIFRRSFEGKGIWLTFEVSDVDREYERAKLLNLPIIIELRDEPWGERHFALIDPNGIPIDIVTVNYQLLQQEEK